METLLYILIGLVVILLGLLVVVFIFTIKRKEPTLPEVKVDQSETLNQLNFVQSSLSQLKLEMDKAFNERFTAQTEKLSESDQKFLTTMREEIDKKLAALNKDVQDKLKLDAEQGKKTFQEIGERINQIVVANKEVVALGEDVKKLSTVISGGGVKKGKFGEFLLESILEEVYSGTTGLYQMQYSFKDVKPDAVIFLPREKGNMLFIDSKFAYDNYARIYDDEGNIKQDVVKLFKTDLKIKIDEVKDKYIIKGETIDYALCFFPSDEIYHFINVNETLKELVSYARKNRVVLVSPATIQPTLYTLKSLMIEYKRSQKLLEVNAMLVSLENEFRLLDDRYNGFMMTFDTLINKRGPLDITVKKLNNQFQRIKDSSEGEED